MQERGMNSLQGIFIVIKEGNKDKIDFSYRK